MKLKFLVVALIFVLVGASVQAQNPPRSSGPDVPFMHGWNPPAALSTDWWNDPEVANELRLTETQKRQLEQVSTNLKLTLIDAGASALKSYVRLQSLLDADQFDKAAYSQQLDAASTTAATLVKDLGQMALTVRTTLTAEQWHKLEAMKAAGRFHTRARGMHDRMHDDMHPSRPPGPRTPPQ